MSIVVFGSSFRGTWRLEKQIEMDSDDEEDEDGDDDVTTTTKTTNCIFSCRSVLFGKSSCQSPQFDCWATRTHQTWRPLNLAATCLLFDWNQTIAHKVNVMIVWTIFMKIVCKLTQHWNPVNFSGKRRVNTHISLECWPSFRSSHWFLANIDSIGRSTAANGLPPHKLCYFVWLTRNFALLLLFPN